MIIVDTNILFDVVTNDPNWFNWSLEALKAAALDGDIVVNAIIYAELSARYENAGDVDDFLQEIGADFFEIPRTAAFLAAKAFGRYRATGGLKTGVLSDFFIGAHATALDIPILTRDVRRYRTYFPDVRLIAPNLN